MTLNFAPLRHFKCFYVDYKLNAVNRSSIIHLICRVANNSQAKGLHVL